nr:MAE_28990/MAE_18760 family HEPN-like nuclease [uncultured Desulfobacter sp.]
MEPFLKEINEDIQWRMGELATIKTLPFRYSINEKHKNFLIQYLVPSCYSIWEGYVKQAFEIYTRKLNDLALSIDNISIQLVSHTLNSNFQQISDGISNQRQVEKYVDRLLKFTNDEFKISSKLPTRSNVNIDVINEILTRYNLKILPEKPYKSLLNKLLRYRNSIAHGDNSIPVLITNVEEFSMTIINLMHDISIRIEEGYLNKTYLRELV